MICLLYKTIMYPIYYSINIHKYIKHIEIMVGKKNVLVVFKIMFSSKKQISPN